MDERIGLGTLEPHPLLRGAESLAWLDLQMRPQQRLSTSSTRHPGQEDRYLMLEMKLRHQSSSVSQTMAGGR